jgi:hypothetical protein
MAEPVEVRIRPHHHDGDVLVGHMEFPEGDPGGGSSAQGSYAFSGWTHLDDIPNDGNAVSIPLGVDSVDYVAGFDFSSGDTRLNGPAGVYMGKLALSVNYPGAPPTSGFVDIMLISTWSDADGNAMTDALIDLEADHASPPSDPIFDYTLVASPRMVKFGLGMLASDGRIELQMTNNTDVPLSLMGQLVLGRL